MGWKRCTRIPVPNCYRNFSSLTAIAIAVSFFATKIVGALITPVLTVEDLTPKFLVFYAGAVKAHADEQERWRLWKQLYDFAAVPPTAEGEHMARKGLDDTWPKYASVLPLIKRDTGVLQPPPLETLKAVCTLLNADVPIRARLIIFVGFFDNNAFTAPGKNGVPTVALPIEGSGATLSLTHEFTHVVEAEQAQLSLGWQRSVAHTIFVEGLAMRAAQRLHPGLPDKSYVGEITPNWFARCSEKRPAILADIAGHLNASDADSVMRYTMGAGRAGVEREAYFTGWLVVGQLLQKGWTFPRLARVKDEAMGDLVAASIKELSGQQVSHSQHP